MSIGIVTQAMRRGGLPSETSGGGEWREGRGRANDDRYRRPCAAQWNWMKVSFLFFSVLFSFTLIIFISRIWICYFSLCCFYTLRLSRLLKCVYKVRYKQKTKNELQSSATANIINFREMTAIVQQLPTDLRFHCFNKCKIYQQSIDTPNWLCLYYLSFRFLFKLYKMLKNFRHF